MKNKRNSSFPSADTVMYVPVQVKQPSRAKRHRLKWSKKLIRKHQLNRIKFVDEEVQARINAQVAAKGSFDAGVAAAAAEMRAKGASKDPAFGGKAYSSKKNNKKVAKKGSKVAKCLAIILSVAILLAAIGFGVLSALNYFLFIPDTDVALENALKAKFDIGTEFDLTKLSERGVITLEANDLDKLGLSADSFSASVAYNKKAASINASVGDHDFTALYDNANGVAFNAESFDEDTYYGVPFENLASQVEKSFFNPDEEGKNAMPEEEYKALLELVKDVEETAENNEEFGEYAECIKDALDEAFEESTISNHEISYGGINVFDKVRSARCVLYNIDNADLVNFAKKIVKKLESPSAEIERAVDKMLRNDLMATTLEKYLGGEIENCEDLADILSDLTKTIQEEDKEWSAKLVFAYVGRAFTAIQLRLVTEDSEMLAVVDFGEQPYKDRTIAVQVDIAREDGSAYSFNANYCVTESDTESLVALSYSTEHSGEVSDELLGKKTRFYSFTIDKSSGDALFEASVKNEVPTENSKPKVTSTDLLEIAFKVSDSKDSLGIELEGMTAGEMEIKIPGSYKLTLSKQSGSIKLPEYKNILSMDDDDYSELCKDFDEYCKELADDTFGKNSTIIGIISGLLGTPDDETPGIPSVDDEQDGDGEQQDATDKPADGEQTDESPEEDDGNIVIDSGRYVYEDGTGYKEIYFFNNGQYTHKCYDGEELLGSEERGAYEIYLGNIILYPNGEADSYELSAEYGTAEELILDGLSYFRE